MVSHFRRLFGRATFDLMQGLWLFLGRSRLTWDCTLGRAIGHGAETACTAFAIGAVSGSHKKGSITVHNRHKPALAALGAASLAPGGCVSTTSPGMSASQSDYLENMLSGRSATTGAALDRALAEAATYPLGSQRNPVRAAMPPGQQAYLGRLRCANGWRPEYERRGRAGDSPYGNIADVYAVTCRDSTAEDSEIFMDMYHLGHVEAEAVPGFDIEAG